MTKSREQNNDKVDIELRQIHRTLRELRRQMAQEIAASTRRMLRVIRHNDEALEVIARELAQYRQTSAMHKDSRP